MFVVPILIQGVILALESLKTNPGTHMKEFIDMFDSETCTYDNVKLTKSLRLSLTLMTMKSQSFCLMLLPM